MRDRKPYLLNIRFYTLVLRFGDGSSFVSFSPVIILNTYPVSFMNVVLCFVARL